jgi:hypothetical protein
MKKLLTLSAFVATASLSFGQGYVSFFNHSWQLVSTNSFPNSTGGSAPAVPAGGVVGSYYYALLVAPTTQTTVDASFTGWTFSGSFGTNLATIGRLYGANDPNGEATSVIGYGPTATANFLVVGWSSNIAATWPHVLVWWNEGNPFVGADVAYFGISAVATNIPLAPFGGPYSNVFGSNAIPNLTLGAYITDPAGTNPPSITGQPQPVTVNAHANASFNVTATGTIPLNYQWSLSGTSIAGATASSLTISNVTPQDLGAYAVVVTNGFGSVTSSSAVLSMYPFLAVPFVGAVTYWGKDATFGVQAWGTGPLSYQWFKDGAAILNATNQNLTIASIQFTNAGLYWVVVSSPLGSVTNAPAQVVVNPAGVSLGLYPGVEIDGVVGYNYIIQRTEDLTNTNAWLTLTNVTLTQPVQVWVDTNTDASLPANQRRFYRVLPGQ